MANILLKCDAPFSTRKTITNFERYAFIYMSAMKYRQYQVSISHSLYVCIEYYPGCYVFVRTALYDISQ